MFDGLKIQEVHAPVPALLTNPRLLFPLSIDEQAGAILNTPRHAYDRGLKFSLIPRLSGEGCRVELTGSIHKYHNAGVHNADPFTLADLLATLDLLLTTFGIDPFTSILNNIEFGVNVVLPFRVARVLDNLISYKGKPFYPDREHGAYYWQCVFGQYVVKIYDKGAQYRDTVPGLPANLLRVEVKVLKMDYLKSRGVVLNTLADLLTVENYKPLGALLVEVFTSILFDEPTIDPDTLNPKDRERYQTGRNPKYWQEQYGKLDTIDRSTLAGKRMYDRCQKKLRREEKRFRALLDKHRVWDNWPNQITGLIADTWEQLTAVDTGLLTAIDERRTVWHSVEKCPILTNIGESAGNRETVPTPAEKCPIMTGLADQPETGKMSDFDPLYLVSLSDITTPAQPSPPGGRETPITDGLFCLVTGVKLDNPRRGQKFVSATMLRENPGLLAEVERLFRCYAKGSKEDRVTRAAHNVRNAYHNQFHNLDRSINRIHRQPVLFDVGDTLRLTADHRERLRR